MDKLTKEQYRDYLVKQIEYAFKWRESRPLINAANKIELMKLEAADMEKLYRLDNEKEKQ